MAGQNTMRVAIVSDTHGFLDPRIAVIVAQCDIAVHAGDIGGSQVLDALEPVQQQVLAVRGNNDTEHHWGPESHAALSRLPQEARLPLPGGDLVVVHGHRAGSVAQRHERLRRAFPHAKAIVYGHSHKLVCDQASMPWVLNPGAAGKARTFGGPSCLVLVASYNEPWHIEIMRLPYDGAVRRRAHG